MKCKECGLNITANNPYINCEECAILNHVCMGYTRGCAIVMCEKCEKDFWDKIKDFT